MLTSLTATTPPSYSFRTFSSLTLATVCLVRLPTCEEHPRMLGRIYQHTLILVVSIRQEGQSLQRRKPLRSGDHQNYQSAKELNYYLTQMQIRRRTPQRQSP